MQPPERERRENRATTVSAVVGVCLGPHVNLYTLGADQIDRDLHRLDPNLPY